MRVFRDLPQISTDCQLQTCFQPLYNFEEFDDLIWDVRLLLSNGTSCLPSQAVIGFAHNFVELWTLSADDAHQRVVRVQCDARCLLYSLAFKFAFHEPEQRAASQSQTDPLLMRRADLLVAASGMWHRLADPLSRAR